MIDAPSPVRAIRLLCRDPAQTARFYLQAFGAVRQADGALLIGRQRVELAGGARGTAVPAGGNSTAFQHFAMAVADMGLALQRLTGVRGWSPTSREGPQALPATSGGAVAFKFRDPEGRPLEFLRFPDARTPEAWARGGDGGAVLGIDHSALAVADVAASVRFYEGLGFRREGGQVNRGAEQARLDGLAGAEVDVVALGRPKAAPPHIELLGYRTPATVRDAAPDGSPLATVLVLEGGARAMHDPDGHRLAVGGA